MGFKKKTLSQGMQQSELMAIKVGGPRDPCLKKDAYVYQRIKTPRFNNDFLQQEIDELQRQLGMKTRLLQATQRRSHSSLGPMDTRPPPTGNSRFGTPHNYEDSMLPPKSSHRSQSQASAYAEYSPQQARQEQILNSTYRTYWRTNYRPPDMGVNTRDVLRPASVDMNYNVRNPTPDAKRRPRWPCKKNGTTDMNRSLY